MSQPLPPVPARGRRPSVKGEKPLAVLATAAESPRQNSWLERTEWVRFWEYMNGGGGISLLLSFFLHVILLALLAIPVFQILKQEQTITSVVQSFDDGGLAIGDPGGMELSLANVAPPSINPMQNLLIDPSSLAPTLLPSVNPSDLPMLPGDSKGGKGGKGGKGKGGGFGIGDGIGGEGGIRIMEPPNAVRAGNFSVWPWPIIGNDIKGKVIHGEPGSSPAVLQPYHIVIRLKVPEGRRSVNLSDFSGQVIGSDRYTQKIPQDSWYYNAQGDLVRGRTGRSIPVIDGTAELLIRVPGAGSAAVRDSITVSSRLTDEEQKIELQFQERTVPR